MILSRDGIGGKSRCEFRIKDVDPGPATQLANGYASLFQKTLRKSLFFCCLYVLDIEKRVLFSEDVSTLEKKGIFFRHFH